MYWLPGLEVVGRAKGVTWAHDERRSSRKFVENSTFHQALYFFSFKRLFTEKVIDLGQFNEEKDLVCLKIHNDFTFPLTTWKG